MRSTVDLRRPTQATELARGLAAGLLLAGLLVGPPTALARWSTWPITGVPSWDQIRDLPTALVSDSALLATLTVAMWAAWALFAACVAVEVAAEVRGRVPRRLVPAGPLQVLARTLVASVAMTIGSLGPPARTDPAVHAQPVTATRAPEPGPAEPADHPTPAPTPAPPAVQPGEPRVIRVVPDDDPWTLAETHLGDGTRWRELWDANRDRVQPDGQRWTVSHHIEPGWTLVLPSATGPAPRADSEITVAAGDTAWDLAEIHLGDGNRWPELFHANHDRIQPDGQVWSDPDLLHVGWHLAVPAAENAVSSTPLPAEKDQATTDSDDPGLNTTPPPGLADTAGSGNHDAPRADPKVPSAAVEDGEPSDTNEPSVSTQSSDPATPPGGAAAGGGG
ncbi:MAG: hypothetical protein ACOC9R_00205, partial [bacterium]